jgi:hypothetical protein
MSPIEVTMGITTLSGSRPLENEVKASHIVQNIVTPIAAMLAKKKAIMIVSDFSRLIPEIRERAKKITLVKMKTPKLMIQVAWMFFLRMACLPNLGSMVPM